MKPGRRLHCSRVIHFTGCPVLPRSPSSAFSKNTTISSWPGSDAASVSSVNIYLFSGLHNHPLLTGKIGSCWRHPLQQLACRVPVLQWKKCGWNYRSVGFKFNLRGHLCTWKQLQGGHKKNSSSHSKHCRGAELTKSMHFWGHFFVATNLQLCQQQGQNQALILWLQLGQGWKKHTQDRWGCEKT